MKLSFTFMQNYFMKPIFSLAILLLSIGCYSQENTDIKVKHDSMTWVGNDLAVLYKKGKSALYDVSTSKFKLKFQKDYLHFFESGNILISIDKDGSIRQYDWEKGLEGTKEFKDGFEVYFVEEGIELRCELIDEDLLVIRDHQYGLSYDMPLANVYGEDSIDFNGNVIYPERLPDVSKSGIFNKSSRKWEIEPKYRRVDHINEHFFIFHGFDDDDVYLTIDWYLLKNQDFIFQKTLSDNQFDASYKISLLSQVLSLDSIKLVSGTDNHYYIERDGKHGLVKFNLFDYTLFEYEELSPVLFDIVLYHPGSRSIVEFDGNEFQYRSGEFNGKDSSLLFNEYVELSGDPSLEQTVYSENKSGAFSNEIRFSVELRENLLIVKNVMNEYRDEFGLSNVYGGDSIDSEGYMVYAPADPGTYSSGVYNLEEKKWIIHPKHESIELIGGEYFLVNDYPLDSNGVILDEPYIQTVYDKNGEILVRVDEYKRSSPLELAKHILPGDSIYYSSNQHGPLSLIKGKDFEPNSLFFNTRRNGGMSTFQVQLGYENEILGIEKLNSNDSKLVLPIVPSRHGDFPSPLVTLFIEKDNLFQVHVKNHFSEFSDSSIMVRPFDSSGLFEVTYPNGMKSFQEGNVKLIFKDSSNTGNVDLGVIVENDGVSKPMTIDRAKYNSLLKSFYAPIDYKITYTDKKVIVENTPLIYNINNVLLYGTDGYGETNKSIQYETENSCIWIKPNDQWVKQGENYASLIPTAYGYIGRTASIQYEIESFGSEVLAAETYDSIVGETKNQEPRYQLLDTSLSVFSYDSNTFFHLIKEYSFGYQIFSVPGKSILVDLDGEILCEDHFENYYEEEGVLYGENQERLEIDPEWGEYVLDEEGNPNVIQEAEKRKIEGK